MRLSHRFGSVSSVPKRTRSDWVSGTFKTSKDEFYEQRARQAREVADLERIQRERPLKPPTKFVLKYDR